VAIFLLFCAWHTILTRASDEDLMLCMLFFTAVVDVAFSVFVIAEKRKRMMRCN